MRVLMVCTGNICRSPMAEAMLKHELERRRITDVEVHSAGTWAGPGNPATVDVVEVLAERGIDGSDHRSTPLEREHLAEADLIVAMTSVHLREIAQIDPDALAKTLLLKEIVEMKVSPSGDRSSGEGRLRALLAGKRPEPRRALDLDDPIGLPRFAYEKCALDVETGMAKLAELLCD